MTAPLPLTHLRPATRKWVADVREAWELDGHHDRLLLSAAETWDRQQQAREAILEHGLTYIDAMNVPHSRPEIAIERDSRLAFARLLRELDLDLDGPKVEKRPPALRSNRRLKVVGDAD